ncbi:MAG: hypothetical protein AB7K52_15935 [Phycisphaerales bacterium]
MHGTHQPGAERAHRAPAGAILAAVLLAAGSAARADLIAYEPFDYPVGGDINGRNGGTGWIGPWQDMLGSAGRGDLITYTPGLTHALRPGTGGSLGATLGQQALAYVRPFERLLLDQQTVWMSMLYRGSGASESVTMGLVFGTPNGFGSVPAIRSSAQGFYQLFVEGSQTAINLPVPGPSANRTDLIVMQYEALGQNQLRFTAFLNPSNPTNPGTPMVTRTVTLATMEIAAFRMIYAGPSPSASSSARFDELGIAETYPGLIPAPGAAALLGVLLLAGSRRRRCARGCAPKRRSPDGPAAPAERP